MFTVCVIELQPPHNTRTLVQRASVPAHEVSTYAPIRPIPGFNTPIIRVFPSSRLRCLDGDFRYHDPTRLARQRHAMSVQLMLCTTHPQAPPCRTHVADRAPLTGCAGMTRKRWEELSKSLFTAHDIRRALFLPCRYDLPFLRSLIPHQNHNVFVLRSAATATARAGLL